MKNAFKHFVGKEGKENPFYADSSQHKRKTHIFAKSEVIFLHSNRS